MASICLLSSRTNSYRISISIKRLALLLISLSLFVLGGCASTASKSTINSLGGQGAGTGIVLMPLDVELALLTAGGVQEPRADWTEAARQNMSMAITDQFKTRGAGLVAYKVPEGNSQLEEKLIDIERLHGAVGSAILIHQLGPAEAVLPTKKDKFDWTLGPDVAALADQYDADYALFIFVRDSYSSAGRVMVQFAAAALGFGIAGGQQLGFASLVDLKTGAIVWFNRLVSTTGDLRTPESAAKTVATLLTGLPQ